MEIYIHIPFCRSKCAYCDFNSRAGADDATIFSYVSALKRELKYAGEKFGAACVKTIYIGGGTPSLLKEAQIERIADAVFKYFKTEVSEFSIECNPESVSAEKLKAYRSAGINRISIGVQSLNDYNLRSIGRIHTAKTALAALELAGKYFDNISADLIVGLPYDTEKIVREETKTTAALACHISAYCLTLEEGAPLYRRWDKGEIILPDDDETQALFEAASDELESGGFERYEISNFAYNGKKSEHNYGYWTREEYIGVGAGAHSLIKTYDGEKPLEKEIRFASLKDINAYIAGINCGGSFDNVPRAEFSILDEDEIEKERIMLGLRTAEGIDAKLLEGKISGDLKEFFTFKEGKAALNKRGMAVMNSVLSELI